MIMEESQNFEQMQQQVQNTATFKIASFERPSEIDNSDIEGEHPGQLKPNLIVSK